MSNTKKKEIKKKAKNYLISFYFLYYIVYTITNSFIFFLMIHEATRYTIHRSYKQ